MKVILTRVSEASVTIEEKKMAQIEAGYLLLVGFTHTDTKEVAEKMVQKIINFRIMADENDKMNKTISDVGGKILAVPQFTLYADVSGRRPGFLNAAKPDAANELFEYFVAQLSLQNIPVEKGVFGANMSVASKNDGPLTLDIEL